MEMELQRSLDMAQRSISVCWCGALTGGTASGVADTATQAEAAVAAAAETAETAAKAAAVAVAAAGAAAGAVAGVAASGAGAAEGAVAGVAASAAPAAPATPAADPFPATGGTASISVPGLDSGEEEEAGEDGEIHQVAGGGCGLARERWWEL